MFRLKRGLHSTVISPEFLDLKLGTDLVRILRQPEFWSLVFLLVRAVYPALRILRLADQQSPAMDKLYYCVRRTDELIKANMKDLNESWKDEKVMAMLSKLNQFLCAEEEEYIEESDDEGIDPSPIDDELEKEDNGAEDDSDSELARGIKRAWAHRRKALIHPYSIAGWRKSWKTQKRTIPARISG
jgi:hypothetical protein